MNMEFPGVAGFVWRLILVCSLVPFAFATFCAYWAQETRRNPWSWFVFGLVLLPFAGITLLYKNARRHPQQRNLDDSGSPELIAARRDLP